MITFKSMTITRPRIPLARFRERSQRTGGNLMSRTSFLRNCARPPVTYLLNQTTGLTTIPGLGNNVHFGSAVRRRATSAIPHLRTGAGWKWGKLRRIIECGLQANLQHHKPLSSAFDVTPSQ